MKAQPTDYRGITFRSKSEAILARCFDLITSAPGTRLHIWEYEPAMLYLNADKYTPDFFLNDIYACSNVNNRIVIEYKPSKPSKSYMQKLSRHANDIYKIANPFEIDFILLTFNPFSKSVERTATVFMKSVNKENYVMPLSDFGITDEIISEAAKFRFDLSDEERQELFEHQMQETMKKNEFLQYQSINN